MGWEQDGEIIMKDSPFLNKDRWLLELNLVVAVDQKGFEVSPGHCLIVPKRIIPMVWDMTHLEWIDAIDALEQMKKKIDVDLKPNGYNIGINCGEVAGQTIFHAHIHLIPRFKGDHPNPRGGVRAVIPDKADWK